MDAIRKAIDAGYIKSCHDLSEGGLAVAAAEMAFSSDHGMKLLLENVPGAKEIRRNDFVLFSESNSRFLVEVIEKRREDFETLMNGSVYSAVGRVEKDRNFSVHGLHGKRLIDTGLAELRVCWERALGG
jgi:phosphoribosylformylglycinamidine synthase